MNITILDGEGITAVLLLEIAASFMQKYIVLTEQFDNFTSGKVVPGASWTANNGSYEFGRSLDQVFSPEEVVEADKNDVVMTITLTMPEEITLANTPFVEGDIARWTLTKELLSQNNTVLRAITE